MTAPVAATRPPADTDIDTVDGFVIRSFDSVPAVPNRRAKRARATAGNTPVFCEPCGKTYCHEKSFNAHCYVKHRNRVFELAPAVDADVLYATETGVRVDSRSGASRQTPAPVVDPPTAASRPASDSEPEPPSTPTRAYDVAAGELLESLDATHALYERAKAALARYDSAPRSAGFIGFSARYDLAGMVDAFAYRQRDMQIKYRALGRVLRSQHRRHLATFRKCLQRSREYLPQ